MPRARYTPFAAALLVLSGCWDDPTRMTATQVHAPVSRAASTEAPAEDVARAFALAMSRPDVRTQVRNAMRASRVTEHKLVLQEFVTTPAGRHLVRAAAEATRQSEETLAARIARLAPLDFYAPFREHRKTWRATAEVTVAAIADKDARWLTSYATDGAQVLLDGNAGVPARALLVLTSAERKSPRIDAQPDTPGNVIQDANDGEISGTYEWIGRDGKVHSVALASLRSRARTGSDTLSGMTAFSSMSSCDMETAIQECSYDEGSSGGGFPPASSDTTFLDAVGINYTDGAFDPSCELVFTTTHLVNDQGVARGTLRVEDIQRNQLYYLHKPMILAEMKTGDRMRINVKETDLLFDDDMGTGELDHSSDDWLKTLRSTFLGLMYETEIEIDWDP